ncbi:MAG TPA: GEVED domain-containing protein, partial [Saprospiraceae bacterium]|nr:GEVED domain-containing protein [Saprospiraceae bacterium]
RIWIDFNRDGDFSDPGEQIFSSNQSNTVIQGTMYLPASATPGPTRLRVTMRWNAYPGPCDAFAWGEVEDYTLVIANNLIGGGSSHNLRSQEGASSEAVGDIRLYPNPANEKTTLYFHSKQSGTAVLEINDLSGKLLKRRQEELVPGDHLWELPIDGLVPGAYLINVRTPERTYQEKLVVLQGF